MATDVTITDPRALAVVQAVATGATLDTLPDGALDKGTFLLMVATDPTLAKAYQRAREISGYALEDEALQMLRQQQAEPGTQQKLRATEALAQQLRWSAEKRNPNVYASKQAVNLQVPIQINTSLDMGGTTGSGTAEFPNIYEIKAQTVQYVDVTEDDVSRAIVDAAGETAEQRKSRLRRERQKRWKTKKQAAIQQAAEQVALDKIAAGVGELNRATQENEYDLAGARDG